MKLSLMSLVDVAQTMRGMFLCNFTLCVTLVKIIYLVTYKCCELAIR